MFCSTKNRETIEMDSELPIENSSSSNKKKMSSERYLFNSFKFSVNILFLNSCYQFTFILLAKIKNQYTL